LPMHIDRVPTAERTGIWRQNSNGSLRFLVRVCRYDGSVIETGAHMSNDGSEVERHAGVDMVPMGEFFGRNPKPDDGTPILDADFKASNPGHQTSGAD
jgi:hypothetical protein